MNIINFNSTFSYETIYITYYLLRFHSQNRISYSNDDEYNWTHDARKFKIFFRMFQIKLTDKSLGKELVEIFSFDFHLTG